MNGILNHDNICRLLPHGKDLVGISEIISYTYNPAPCNSTLDAIAIVGEAPAMLDNDGVLLPDAILELCVQATAIGSAMSQQEKQPGNLLSGMIAKVTSLNIAGLAMPTKGERMLVHVQWNGPVGGALVLEGHVVLEKNSHLIGEVECIVLQGQQ